MQLLLHIVCGKIINMLIVAAKRLMMMMTTTMMMNYMEMKSIVTPAEQAYIVPRMCIRII